MGFVNEKRSKICTSALELIGGTPLMELERLEQAEGVEAHILAKLEYLNPAGSVKDRIGKQMIEDAEEKGALKEGDTICEPTSGNTGIGLAMAAAVKGYRLILTMPETMSVERRNILKAYGAEIVLTDGARGMQGAIAKAEELARTTGAFLTRQFSNPSNPKAHYLTTGPEIWEQSGGRVDILVAGVGTGGTLTGCGRYLREQNPEVRIVAVEPETSAVLSGRPAGSHAIQGLGAGFIPDTMCPDLVDEVIRIDNTSPFTYAKKLARTEGLLCGISSGAALEAAVQVAKREENAGKTIVCILPDSADRYYSTPLFQA